jgi:copper homeostasis protein
MVKKLIRETCVESEEEIDIAKKGGADRIELCANLEIGGTSPAPSIADYAISRNLEVAVMIRVREGFLAVAEDIEIMKNQIRVFNETRIKAFVFGFLNKDGEIDFPAMKSLIEEVKGKELVFHMAFDELGEKQQFAAINSLSELGFARILTKGGKRKATNNVKNLKALREYAEDKIVILCGGGVTDNNYEDLAFKTGITQFHGRKLGLRLV